MNDGIEKPKRNIVDLRTLEEYEGPPPVADTAIEDVLNHVRLLNMQGEVKAVVVTVIDQSNHSYYVASIPRTVPPNVFIGAVELTKEMLMRDIYRAAMNVTQPEGSA